MPCSIGFTLQPERAFLECVAPLLAHVDYLEVAPETTWRTDAEGTLVPNGFHACFLALGARYGKSFVAHGVGLSIGSDNPRDADRRAQWLARVAADQQQFAYRWYTDHLGASALDGQSLVLPLPLPMTPHVAATVRAQLDAMQRVVPIVGVENTAQSFMLGCPLDEPEFLRRALGPHGHHLLLDLHNLVTTASNVGFDPRQWLARLDLDAVIEIHVAGGTLSDPGWLRSQRVFRLDSHDAAVPQEVWTLLEDVAPRCPHLRGITLERMEGTVQAADVPGLGAELRRLRAIAEALP